MANSKAVANIADWIDVKGSHPVSPDERAEAFREYIEATVREEVADMQAYDRRMKTHP